MAMKRKKHPKERGRNDEGFLTNVRAQPSFYLNWARRSCGDRVDFLDWF